MVAMCSSPERVTGCTLSSPRSSVRQCWGLWQKEMTAGRSLWWCLDDGVSGLESRWSVFRPDSVQVTPIKVTLQLFKAFNLIKVTLSFFEFF